MVLLRHDYSWAERALGFWSTMTLMALSVASLGLRYVASPIACWVPHRFDSSHRSYVEEVCFQRTRIHYYLRGVFVPDYTAGDIDSSSQLQYTFHQWVPFALGIAAILCIVPHVLWCKLSGFLWMDAHALAQALCDNQRQNAAGRHAMLQDSARLLQAGLKRGSWMLSVATLLRKGMSLMVCVALLVLAKIVFSPQLGAWRAVVKGQDWDYNVSLPLPDKFLCDVTIPQLQSAQHYTVLCALPLSQVYSKGFTYLFYLFLLLALCCLLDVLTSLCRLVIPGLKDLALHRYLAVSGSSQDPQAGPLTSRFLDSLGLDGHLVLAVTADACGPLAAADLTNHMFLAYKGGSRPGPAPATSVSAGHAPATVGPAPLYPSAAIGGTAPVMGRAFAGEGNMAGSADAIPLLPMSGQGEGSNSSKPQ